VTASQSSAYAAVATSSEASRVAIFFNGLIFTFS
jgi:hypothetical protein